MSVRRINFKKTSIEVPCRTCGRPIEVGSKCVTLVTFSEAITYEIEGNPYESFLDGEVYRLVTRCIRGQAPLVKVELVCAEGYPISLKKSPVVAHIHWEKCGIDHGPIVKQVVDGSYGSRHG